jgi:hypothetical protein
LTFAVGTSLLTASLATVGCADKTRVNVRPPEEHVNEGPEPEPEQTPEETLDATTDGPEQPDPGVEEPRTVNVRHADPK